MGSGVNYILSQGLYWYLGLGGNKVPGFYLDVLPDVALVRQPLVERLPDGDVVLHLTVSNLKSTIWIPGAATQSTKNSPLHSSIVRSCRRKKMSRL